MTCSVANGFPRARAIGVWVLVVRHGIAAPYALGTIACPAASERGVQTQPIVRRVCTAFSLRHMLQIGQSFATILVHMTCSVAHGFPRARAIGVWVLVVRHGIAAPYALGTIAYPAASERGVQTQPIVRRVCTAFG